MKRSLSNIALIGALIFIPISAHAFSWSFVQQENYNGYERAGFFSGFWHGLIAPWSLGVRLFSPICERCDVGMYAYQNTGWFYDLSFLIGIALSGPVGWFAAIIAAIVLLL